MTFIFISLFVILKGNPMYEQMIFKLLFLLKNIDWKVLQQNYTTSYRRAQVTGIDLNVYFISF